MVPRRSQNPTPKEAAGGRRTGGREREEKEKATHPSTHPPTLERGVAVCPVIGSDGNGPGRRAWHLGLLDGLHRRGARWRLPPPFPRTSAAPAPRPAPAGRPAGGVARPRRVGLPHARARPRHARPHPPRPSSRRSGMGWAGRGEASRGEIGARPGEVGGGNAVAMHDRPGGGGWLRCGGGSPRTRPRGAAGARRKRDANFVVVVVGENEVEAGEGGGGVGWLAAVCASAVRPPSRYVSFWPGLPLLPHTSGVGAVRRRPVVVPWCWAAPARGGRREEEASASASPPSRRAWTRSVVGGWSFRARSLFWLGWGGARLVGVGPG